MYSYTTLHGLDSLFSKAKQGGNLILLPVFPTWYGFIVSRSLEQMTYTLAQHTLAWLKLCSDSKDCSNSVKWMEVFADA